MEKDYFKDRPEECRIKNSLKIGSEAFICLKSMQKTAKELSDLTRITISEHLTNQDYHPMGCKLKGYNYERDCFGNLKYNNGLIVNTVVGRCTYPIIYNNALTSSGNKAIVFSDNKLILRSPDKINCDLYNLVIVFTFNEIELECLVNPYNYIPINELKKELSLFDLSSVDFSGEYVILNQINNYQIAVKPFNYKINNEEVSYEYFSNYIYTKYLSSKEKIILIPKEWYGIKYL